MIGGGEPTRGEILRQRPNRFAMRWTHPRGDLFVIDGQYQWIYLPSSTPNQVIRSRLTGRPGESADVFDEFLDKPHERFAVAYVRADRASGRDADVIALTPREPRRRVLTGARVGGPGRLAGAEGGDHGGVGRGAADDLRPAAHQRRDPGVVLRVPPARRAPGWWTPRPDA